MREQLLGHHVVRLDGSVDVFTVNADCDAHQHVLRTFDNLAVYAEKVASLEGLEAEILENIYKKIKLVI